MYHGYYHELNKQKPRKKEWKLWEYLLSKGQFILWCLDTLWLAHFLPIPFDKGKGTNIYGEKNMPTAKGHKTIHRTPGFGNKEYGKSGMSWVKYSVPQVHTTHYKKQII